MLRVEIKCIDSTKRTMLFKVHIEEMPEMF